MNFFHHIHKTSFKVGCLLMLAVFTACSDEVIDSPENNPDPQPQAEKFYIDLNVTLPGSSDTRNSTGTNGETDNVTPSANESVLESARIYFCTKDAQDNYTVVAQCETNETSGPLNGPNYTIRPNSEQNTTHRLEIEVELNELKKLIGKTVYLFFVGNPELISEGLENWKTSNQAVDKNPAEAKIGAWPVFKDYVSSLSASEAERSKGQKMPLVNADVFEVSFGSGLSATPTDTEIAEAIKNLFSQKASFGYGRVYKCPNTLQLERAVARVDFKYTQSTVVNGKTDYEYPINNADYTVRLDRIGLVNLNSRAYLYKHTIKGSRTSAFNVPGESVKLFGIENGAADGESTYNWVYGSDWSNAATPKGTTDLLNKLDWNYIDREANPQVKELVPVNGFSPVEITMSNLEKHPIYDENEAYHPWGYIYENTIPTSELMSEENIWQYATGLVFKFVLLANPDEENDGKRPDLNPDLVEEKKCSPNIVFSNEAGAAYKNTITITNNDGKWMDVEYVEGVGYELTYYAWIVHNEVDPETVTVTDPSDNTTTSTVTVPGPMAYGIVRNNVYQLSIKSINDIPNPRDPRTIFLDLECEVRDWNVRWDEDVKLY